MGWAGAGGALAGAGYALFVGLYLNVEQRFPDLLLLQVYMALAGALVGAVLLSLMLGVAVARRQVDEPRPAQWLAMGAVGYLLILQLAAGVLREVGIVHLGVWIGISLALTLGLGWGFERLARSRSHLRVFAGLAGAFFLVSLGVQIAGVAMAEDEQVVTSTEPHWPKPEGKGRRVLWFSIDGGSWTVMRPMIDQGKLPTLGRLTREGASGVLQSEPPGNSSTLNTTLATGRRPADHGIERMLQFQIPGMEPLPAIEDEHDYGGPIDAFYVLSAAGLRVGLVEAIPPMSGSRRTRALWSILDASGRATAVVGWFCTWPAEDVRHGRIVSDRFGHSEFGMFYRHQSDLQRVTHPPQLADRLRDRLLGPSDVPPELLALADWTEEDRRGLEGSELSLIGLNTRTLLKYSFNADRSKLAVLHALLDEGQQPDLTMIHLTSADVAGHIFWGQRFPEQLPHRPSDEELQRYGQVLDRAYAHLDAELAKLLERLDPETVVVVTSDHGMTAQKHLLGWGKHAIEGVYIVSGPGIAHVESELSIYDITPLILHLQGLPKADDMPGRVPRELLTAPGQPESIPSYERPG